MPASAQPDVPFIELACLGKNEVWRYLLSFLLIAGLTLFLVGASLLVGDELGIALAPIGEASSLGLFERLGNFVLLMWSIIALLIATRVVTPLVHRRPFATFVHPGAGFDWRAFRISALVALLLPVVAVVIFAYLGAAESIAFHFDPVPFFAFLPVVLALMPLQVLAEEVFTRGYVMQGVAWATKKTWVRLFLPAVFFTALHLANEEVYLGGVWAIADYFVISTYLGILVLRGNGLEYAIGMHLGNNLFLTLVVDSNVANLGTPSLATQEFETVRDAFGPDIVLGEIVYCAAHYVLTFSSTRGARSRKAR